MMCSVVETEPLESTKATKKRNKDKGKSVTKTVGGCMKCSEMARVLVRNGDPLCKSCFLDYIVHKFRATIGKARVIRQGEKALLAVSGGSTSAAMLDLVIRGLSKEAGKKLRFQPGVVYIDEGELFGRSAEERQVARENIKSVANKVGFPFHFASLEDIFSETTCNDINDLNITQDALQTNSSLVEFFNNVGTITAKEDLLLHLRRWLLLKVAKEHGYDRVMVGDCSTTLSVRILSDVSQGRGSQLPFHIGFQDNRSEISILRPMREFSKKEIEFYNNFNQVISFSSPSFSTKASVHASINRLTQDFIFGLQAAFPSTVNTVLRTGDKVTSSDIAKACDNCCSLCGAPLAVNGDFTISSGGDIDSGNIDHAGNGDGTSVDVPSISNRSDNSSGDGCGGVGGGKAGDGGDSSCGHTCDNDGVYNDKSSGGCDGHADIESCSKNGAGCDGDGGVGSCKAGDGGDSSCGHTGDNDGVYNDKSSGGCDGHADIIESCTKNGAGCDGTSKESCCNKSTNNVTSDFHKLAIHNLSTTLCYGCKLTYNDLNTSQTILPEFLTENAIKTFRRTAMMEEIKEFLIDDLS